MAVPKSIPWPEIVELVRTNHNGVMAVFLYFGHDGDNNCRFADGDGRTMAEGGSGRSMQEAVEIAYYQWYIVHAGFSTLMGEAMSAPAPQDKDGRRS